ncbi:MAG: heparinase II/III family protein [Clostridia bacterium]|nr:heparinase II/III family protein [Clostridia bacterium]
MLTEALTPLSPLLAPAAARRPWPREGDPAWAALPEDRRETLLRWGEEAMAEGYEPLLASQHLRFTRDGDRRVFETPYFARRKALLGALFAECVRHEARAVDFIADGLWLLMEETSWVISAHNDSGAPLPDPDAPGLDLFAAQTGATVALCLHLAGHRLDAVTPLIAARALRELDRRVWIPFLQRDDFFWMGITRKNLNNWTPWIVSNVLLTAQYALQDEARLEAIVRKSCAILDRYLACQPEDGGCDEGTAYWNMAGASLLDCLEALREVTGGRLSVYHEPLIQAIARFPLRSHVAGPWFWNFADCDARPLLDGERLFTFGQRIGDPALSRLGQAIGVSLLPRDTPQASRVMNALFTPFAPAEAPVPPDWTALPRLQVWAKSCGGLYAVIKGGHNHESHNHNDIGSLMIYADGQPVIVDAGNLVYTARTFSAERYTLWNTRSMYHNVPLIGDHGEQAPGAEHRAAVLSASEGAVRMDIAAAYGAGCGVSALIRTLAFYPALTLTDEIRLSEPQTVTWVFLTCCPPDIHEEAIHIGPLRLTGTQGLRVHSDAIPVTDQRLIRNYPALWRLTLTADAAQHHQRVFRFTLPSEGSESHDPR